MSYIRCTSNPENLYIFENLDKQIEFMWGEHDFNENNIKIDSKNFKDFMKKVKGLYGYVDRSPVKHKNISLQEIRFNRTLGRIETKEPSFENDYSYDVLICLKINKKKILMFEVTWRYFYDNYIEQNFLPTNKWRK